MRTYCSLRRRVGELRRRVSPEVDRQSLILRLSLSRCKVVIRCNPSPAEDRSPPLFCRVRSEHSRHGDNRTLRQSLRIRRDPWNSPTCGLVIQAPPSRPIAPVVVTWEHAVEKIVARGSEFEKERFSSNGKGDELSPQYVSFDG